MITLEKYRGTRSRYTCPSCHTPNNFVRYVKTDGSYLSEMVGRCNRESKCGYHYKPKEYFQDNSQSNFSKKVRRSSTSKKNQSTQSFTNRQNRQSLKKTKPFDAIPAEQLTTTLDGYQENAFVQFLLNLFPEDAETVWQAVKTYFLGTLERKTVFWQIDQCGRIRTGKVVLYNERTGKRMAETFTNRNGEVIEIKANWVHARLKKQGKLKEDFSMRQCFFGEHLLQSGDSKSIAIVEAEKTAVIASICFPECVWLACGGKKNLKVENLKRLGRRQIIIYPDADGFAEWHKMARKAQMQGLNIKVSSVIENQATGEEKAQGCDLADYLINQQKTINCFNSFADDYNLALDRILGSDLLMQEFEIILEEQKSIAIANSDLSEDEADNLVNSLANYRNIVLGI